MTTIKKTGILVILTFACLIPAWPENGFESYGFSLSPLTGILYGQAEEIVYKYRNRGLPLSQLLWDLKPLVYVGFAVDLGPQDPFQKNGFAAAASLKYGLPLKTGIMEDRDWDNYQFDYLTHYSRHDAYSRNAVLSDISAGYSWRLGSSLVLKAYGEFSYMHFSWSAENGYVQYPPSDPSRNYPKWNENLPKIYINEFDIYGEVIRYVQDWFILSPGLSLKGKVNRFFFLEGNFNYSPLIYCSARDDHLLTGVTYLDHSYFGHCIKGSGGGTFSPNEKTGLSLTFSYKYITGPRGDEYIAGSVFPQSAGAGYSAFDLGLAVKIRLTDR